VVAVDAVDANPEQVVELPLVLRVPTEARQPEAVEQGGQPARPVGLVEVDGVDPSRGQAGRSALRPLLDPFETRGVDESDPGVEPPPGGHRLPVRMAEPQPSKGPRVSVGHGNYLGCDRRVHHVEGHLAAGSNGLVEVLKGGESDG
ncbi:uncharacterized protein METZ01_LOCUS203705, partial [marine metagenome]